MDSNILDDEFVIRYLKRRFFDQALRQWSTDAFELRHGENYISVCRSKYLQSPAEGVKHSFPEKMWKSIIAYSDMNVRDIRQLSSNELNVNVVAFPTAENSSHAGITSAINGTAIVGIPTQPTFYNLQGKLLEIALPNIKEIVLE